MANTIKTYCEMTVAPVTPDQMRNGIAKYLPGLVGSQADRLLPTVRVEDMGQTDEFNIYQLYYQADSDDFITVRRLTENLIAPEITDDYEEMGDITDPPRIENVRQVLLKIIEIVEFDLAEQETGRDAQLVALAAAGWLAEISNGIIQDDAGNWQLPTPHGLSIILRNAKF